MRYLSRRLEGKVRSQVAVVMALAVLASVVASLPAAAGHGLASLPGSNFEIDNDANLVVDDVGMDDWASVIDTRNDDAETGKNDDSYAGGSKEDDPCPGTTTGSIPNNKSDLLTFGTYVEPEVGGPGWLHLFWTRVQEPNGTTLMDFELNQSSTDCGNGVNPVRTVGDLLIEYRIEQGGAAATIRVREWSGSEWGAAQDLTAIGAATGTINDSAILAADSDGLGNLSPRTFGEASLDLDFVFDETSCDSFGSAFLKSRASDSFTSQMKDYIAPVPVNITNCGKVIIRKQTDPTPDTTDFGFTKSFGTDPATGNTFSLADGESMTFTNVLFGTGYTVDETSVPSGWDFDEVDCSASSGVTPSISGSEVTFDIDNAADVLDCTYHNEARGTIVVEKVADAAGSFEFTSSTLSPSTFTLATTDAGQAGTDSETFSDLVPGTYDVAETVPNGWDLQSATCDDGSDPSSIGLDAGETVTCTFVDARQTGAILITKTRKHAADGSGDHPHEGVTFTVTGGELAAGGVERVTDSNGEACLDGLVLSSFVGDYTVTEGVPTGYVADQTSDTVSVTTKSTCGDGNQAEVNFHNTPLTDLTVAVDSQVPGGTSSTIECALGSTVLGSAGPGGDIEVALEDLEPGTYICTVIIDP